MTKHTLREGCLERITPDSIRVYSRLLNGAMIARFKDGMVFVSSDWLGRAQPVERPANSRNWRKIASEIMADFNRPTPWIEE